MNFSDMWQTWIKVLTGPNELTFASEQQKPTATLTTAMIWMVIAGLIAGILGWLQSLIFAGSLQGALPQVLAQMDLPPETMAQIDMALRSGVAGSFGATNLASIITVPVGFLIGAFILFLIGKVLGGQADFGRYAYLLATFNAPLTILGAILALIPILGCIGIVIPIYQLVLTYYATKVEQQLTSGKALIVVLIPVIIGLVLVGCAFVGLIGMFAALQNAQ